MATKSGRGGAAPGIASSSSSSSISPSSSHRQVPSTSSSQQQQQQQQQQSPPSTQDLTPYLGLPLRLTLLGQEDTPAIGLLFAHDTSSGLVILETGAYPYPDYPAKAAAAPTTRRHQAVVSAIGGFSRRDPTGFRLIKERIIKDVVPLSLEGHHSTTGATTNGHVQGLPPALPKKLSEVRPVNVAIAEKREVAASKEAHSRAARIGVGVSEIGQDVFEALSKTLPCRWHDKHIIVMDEVVLSEPYDSSSLRVPKYSSELLEKLLDSSKHITPEEVPDKESVATARGKARSWERVRRVLEGERKKIEDRRTTAAT